MVFLRGSFFFKKNIKTKNGDQGFFTKNLMCKNV